MAEKEKKIVKLDRFKPRSYQLPIVDAIENKGMKKIIAVMPRRAGKDIAAFNIAVRQALRKRCIIYYLLPTFSQARRVIWDCITIDGKRLLDFIPEELIVSLNSSEMKITFFNGSILQLAGSDSYNRLVGTNPYAVIFSEYSRADPNAYKFISPILAANGGWCLFISCVAPNTLVISEKGLKRISKLSDSRKEYTKFNSPIFGLNGFNNATDFYYGGKQETLKIKLASGFEIECTKVHPLWNGSEWIKSRDLKLGDLLPIQYGQNVFGSGLDISDFVNNDDYRIRTNVSDLDLNKDYFYLLGLIHADGSFDSSKVTITKKKDHEIVSFINKFGFRTQKDGIHHVLSATNLVNFLEYLGFKRGAKNKTFPEKLFECTKEQLAAFLQGLFDGDGNSNTNHKKRKRGHITFASACEGFVLDLQVVLLNFGIVSLVSKRTNPPTKKVKASSVIFILEIEGYFAYKFFSEIGFRLKRKQKVARYISEKIRSGSGNVYPVNADIFKFNVTNPSKIRRRTLESIYLKHPGNEYLKSLLKEKLFYSRIVSITNSESEVFDFVIPETHSFFSNGFISHNTPFGHNSFYDLWKIAKQNPKYWFAYRLTCDDTKHISKEVIQREIDEGVMSEDLVQQEYYCSFDMGVEGSYYSKIMNNLRLKGQITNVPYDPAFKVHTAWDLGVSDATCIIWFQIKGQSVSIIDSYTNIDLGLDHYAKIIHSKDYAYGKHWAPHDIQVREWAGGAVKRIDRARQLGINFHVAPKLPISDGIEAVRALLPRVWIDERNCDKLIKALESYRREYDNERKVYADKPFHDSSSHFSDCARLLAISVPSSRDEATQEDVDELYNQAMYGSSSGLPDVFR